MKQRVGKINKIDKPLFSQTPKIIGKRRRRTTTTKTKLMEENKL